MANHGDYKQMETYGNRHGLQFKKEASGTSPSEKSEGHATENDVENAIATGEDREDNDKATKLLIRELRNLPE